MKKGLHLKRREGGRCVKRQELELGVIYDKRVQQVQWISLSEERTKTRPKSQDKLFRFIFRYGFRGYMILSPNDGE